MEIEDEQIFDTVMIMGKQFKIFDKVQVEVQVEMKGWRKQVLMKIVG